MSLPTEWRCDCGAWVPIGCGRHTHATQREPTLAEMHAARATGNPDVIPVVLSHVWRTRHEVR
jgi:hypothetical protein